MTAVTTESVRRELRDLDLSDLNDPLALTFRFKKQSKWKEPLDEIRAEKNIAHFLKIVSRNSKVYGNRAKRFGKTLAHWFEFQGTTQRNYYSDYLHLHGFLDCPEDIWTTGDKFKKIVSKSWKKTPFGSHTEWGQNHKDVFYSDGWKNYITRADDVGRHTITNLYEQ